MTTMMVFLLLAAGLFLMLLEIFIPSYGLLSVGGVGCLGASLYFSFQQGTVFGLIVLLLIVILLPTEVVIGVKLFPSTWMGRKIVIGAAKKTEKGERSSDEDILGLVGKEGTTVMSCRPAGMAEIEGERVDVVAEGTMIDSGRPIRVVQVDGNRVVIREREA